MDFVFVIVFVVLAVFVFGIVIVSELVFSCFWVVVLEAVFDSLRIFFGFGHVKGFGFYHCSVFEDYFFV